MEEKIEIVVTKELHAKIVMWSKPLNYPINKFIVEAIIDHIETNDSNLQDSFADEYQDSLNNQNK